MPRLLALSCLLVLPACPRPPLMCMILEEYDPSGVTCSRLSEGPRIWHPIDIVNSGDSLYVFGSYHAMRHDLENGTWNPLDPPIEFGSVEVRAFEAGGRFLVFGEREVQSFEPVKCEWSLLAQIPSKRWYYGAAMLNGKVYVAGGDTPDGVTADLLVYDPAKDAWAALKPMKRPRTNLALEAAAGKLWAIGGHYRSKGGDVPVRDVESYDLAADSWTEAGLLDAGVLWKRPASAALNNRIYLFLHDESRPDRVVMEFDPASGKWTSKSADKLIRRDGCEAATARGKILILGGFTKDYHVEDTPDGAGRAVFR